MTGDIFSYLYQFADVFAFLILSAAGLAIVFGMMGVINMAHGEFIMCGAYVTVGLVNLGFPLLAAQLCGAIVAGLIGVLSNSSSSGASTKGRKIRCSPPGASA